MARSRASAKKAGSDLEIGQETYWREILRQPDIYRGRNQGATDKGDILGVRYKLTTGPLTIECKNEAKINLGTWWKEAERERLNNKSIMYGPPPDGEKEEWPSPAAIIVHKRRGFDAKKQPGKQWVTLTVEELIALIRGNRDHIQD